MTITALSILLLCTVFLCIPANAEEQLVNLYSMDGRIATVPLSERDTYLANGWWTTFPYYQSQFWVRSVYLENYVTDIYGADTIHAGDIGQTFTKITVEWYDDSDFAVLNEQEKFLNTLIFDLDGAKYRMPYSDLLRGRSPNANYTQIFWDNPKSAYGIADESWRRIQNYWIWKYMPMNEFWLMVGAAPDGIISSDEGGIHREQWVYVDNSGYTMRYYFDNGLLTYWEF